MGIDSIDKINDDDELSRFLTSNGHKNNSGVIKPGAFMPNYNEQKQRYELSMFCTQGLLLDDLKSLIKLINLPKYYGRALITGLVVENAALKLDLDNSPPRHLTIIGWDSNQDKSRRRLEAAKLAKEATYSELPLRI